MLDSFFGLPVHPLIVHATVVLIPSAAITVALAGVWARFRAWAGWLPTALAVAAVILTPLSTSSGESFERRLGHSTLIEKHSHLADMLIWWVAPLAVVAVAQWWFVHRGTPSARLRGVLAILGVLLAAGTLVQVVLVGHSGAKAAWSDASGPFVRGLPVSGADVTSAVGQSAVRFESGHRF